MGAGKTTTLVGGGSSYIVEYVEQGLHRLQPARYHDEEQPKGSNVQGKCGNTELGAREKKTSGPDSC